MSLELPNWLLSPSCRGSLRSRLARSEALIGPWIFNESLTESQRPYCLRAENSSEGPTRDCNVSCNAGKFCIVQDFLGQLSSDPQHSRSWAPWSSHRPSKSSRQYWSLACIFISVVADLAIPVVSQLWGSILLSHRTPSSQCVWQLILWSRSE